MKRKSMSVPSLLFAFLSSVSFFVSSTDFSGSLRTSVVQQTQDGLEDFSSSSRTSDGGGSRESLLHKKYSSFTNSKMNGKSNFRKVATECKLGQEILTQLAIPGTSNWLVNSTTFQLLERDLQKLIDCTMENDKIMFCFDGGVIQPAKTMEISHPLDLIANLSKSVEETQTPDDIVTFTCPESGPFLRVDGTLITIDGFVIKNCSQSSGEGVVIIKSKSLVIFYRTRFTDNTNRAVYVANEASAAFVRTEFIRNRAKANGGAAIHMNGGRSDIYVFKSLFQENNAKEGYGGAIFLGMNDSASIHGSILRDNIAVLSGAIYTNSYNSVEIRYSALENNTASRGGCFFARRSSLNISSSEFYENFSYKSGGCFYFEGSNASLYQCGMFANQAREHGGALYVSATTILYLQEIGMAYNKAENSGGAIALRSGSRVHCDICEFSRNRASQGGGCYIEAKATQEVVAHLQSSLFVSNNASYYGGGMVVKVYGTKNTSCSNFEMNCGRILLLDTDFVHNYAAQFGAILVATTLEGILISCNATSDILENKTFFSREYISTLVERRYLKRLALINCGSWRENWLSVYAQGAIIGTFGRKPVAMSHSMDGKYIYGTSESPLVLVISKGNLIPQILVVALDAFENIHVPTFYEEFALRLSSRNHFLPASFELSFKDGMCTIDGITSFVPVGNYIIRLQPKIDSPLEAMNLTISVRECSLNEFQAQNSEQCVECDALSYNFNVNRSTSCLKCPTGANCTGKFIVPRQGYWHKGPCHTKMKRCVVKEACEYSTRYEAITDITQDFKTCNISAKELEQYEYAQCNVVSAFE